ncbi:MAG TPA: RNA polymerase sigma factor [Verrucomicrobiae bacterium]|nr:RNA polymerase sigma factor [Verrucomicrobiae bacterium]
MDADNADRRFLELVQQNQARLQRVCRVYAWQQADQNDLYQEILFQIWRGLPGLRTAAHANTWLYRVAINTAITFVRKRAPLSGRVVHFAHDELARAIESRQTAGEETDNRLADLYSAIHRLNPLEKALVTLFLEDFTYEQMAEATGIQPNHVGVLLHRAKKKLSALMKEEAPK